MEQQYTQRHNQPKYFMAAGKPSIIITTNNPHTNTVPANQDTQGPVSAKPKSQAPRLARFICFLFQALLSGQKLIPQQARLHLSQPAYLVIYIEKLLEITQSPLPAVMLSLHYIEKSIEANPSIKTASPAEQLKLFSVASMLSQKYTDDHPYSNKIWAKVIGIDTNILTKCEHELLHYLNFNLHLSLEKYASFCKQIQTLAKYWNQFVVASKSNPALVNNWMTPMTPISPSFTPITPTTSISVSLNRIERKIDQTPSGLSAYPRGNSEMTAFPFDQTLGEMPTSLTPVATEMNSTYTTRIRLSSLAPSSSVPLIPNGANPSMPNMTVRAKGTSHEANLLSPDSPFNASSLNSNETPTPTSPYSSSLSSLYSYSSSSPSRSFDSNNLHSVSGRTQITITNVSNHQADSPTTEIVSMAKRMKF